MTDPTIVWRTLALLFAAGIVSAGRALHAQSFGVELHNTLMPAAGGMGGVSIAQPQDLTSAINGNPATLTQFEGTQFLFGGAWAEPTFNLTQTSIPVVSVLSIIGGPFNFNPVPDDVIKPFSAKSTAEGTLAGNIGVTKDLNEFGLPATLGIGFVTTVSSFVDFRQVPQSLGTNWGLAISNVPVAVGVDLTDRLSAGAVLSLGIAQFDGPFVWMGGMSSDYALRGTLGVTYKTSDFTTVGAYYQTEQSYRFNNAFVRRPGSGQETFDAPVELPQNIGLGIANSAALDGRLLLGVDVLYKLWDQTDFYHAVYDNQWVVQAGAQYSAGRYRLRAGYVWAENAIDHMRAVNIDNVGSVNEWKAYSVARYIQGVVAVTGQHRISAGVGIVDVLPGMDFDFMAGGTFRDTEQFGYFTTTSRASYWIGFGLTGRF